MPKSIIFVDSRVADYQSLIDSFVEPAEVFVLDGTSDGLAQMAVYLQGRTDIDAIHVISHGSQGVLYLGSMGLNSSNVALHGSQLAGIGSSLTQTGDILLYGCNVAQGDVGLHFITSLAQYTGADVAASDDATGAAALGGDWVLEQASGIVDAIPIAVIDYRYILPGDATPPVLTSLNVPATIDLSKGETRLTITGTATDDSSGVQLVAVWFDKNISLSNTYPSSSGFPYFSQNMAGLPDWSDSWADGTSSHTFAVSTFNSDGIYNVTKVDISDTQGNTRTYSASQLQALGVNTAIAFVGANSDATPPVLTSLNVPATIDLSKGETRLTITGTATDDSSGVQLVAVWFDKNISLSNTYPSSSGFPYFSQNMAGLPDWSDSWADGTSSHTFAVSTFNSDGIYNVTKVDISDTQGNTRTYSASQLQALGVNTAIAFSHTHTNSLPTGTITIAGTPTQSQTVTAVNNLTDLDGLGAMAYQWKVDGSAIFGATGNAFVIAQAQVGKTITVAVSYTDGYGTAESVASTATGLVANVNDAPTGSVTISGTPTQGQTLTAANTLADVDGIGTISYQWQAGDNSIAAATASTYTLTQAEVGKVITVIASYIDLFGSAESKISTATSTVVANQTFTGSTGNDSLTGSAGNDSIDGGAGVDTAVYSISRSNFALSKTSTGFTLTDNTGVNGTDTLLNVERIKFSDGAIALDVGASQPAGQTAMLLGAVLPGRLAFDSSKQALLGAAIDLFDQGFGLQTLSGAVMRLPIWDILTQKTTPTNTDIATYLLTNVNGVAPDATTLANAVTSLNTETSFATQGNFLWHLAESNTNQTHVGLVGLASTGLAFTI